MDEADLSFRDQRARRLRARRSAAAAGEARAAKSSCSAPGPERAAQTIREALAKGADRAIHIEEEDLETLDTLAIARLLAEALEAEKPDLILTGLQSDDLGYGQTGVVLAELLGLPHATIIMQVEVERRLRPREARTRGRLVPARRDAAARGADYSVRHQQAALRDADGHQESQDQGDPKRSRPPTGRRSESAVARSRGSMLPERQKQTQLFDGRRRRKRPRNWWRS